MILLYFYWALETEQNHFNWVHWAKNETNQIIVNKVSKLLYLKLTLKVSTRKIRTSKSLNHSRGSWVLCELACNSKTNIHYF